MDECSWARFEELHDSLGASVHARVEGLRESSRQLVDVAEAALGRLHGREHALVLAPERVVLLSVCAAVLACHRRVLRTRRFALVLADLCRHEIISDEAGAGPVAHWRHVGAVAVANGSALTRVHVVRVAALDRTLGLALVQQVPAELDRSFVVDSGEVLQQHVSDCFAPFS